MSRQIEMTWVCSACDKRNLGRHKACQNCGDPKDKGEAYEMPSDTASAPSVTDDSLLRFAGAGPNWRCSFCGSDQRRLDNTCGQCGAPIATAEEEPALAVTLRTRGERLWAWTKRNKLGVIFFTAAFLIFGIVLWVRRERDYTAKVVDAVWDQAIIVERYTIWQREGWRQSEPSGAFEVVSLGQKVHHYDTVYDHTETEYYTEQVACGETCSESSPSCHEECSSNNNGFATCHQVCSGGGRSCSTKWCSEQRSRQVPKYRQEPRYAEAISYKIWDWGIQRTLHATGHGIEGLRWPTEEAHIGESLKEREQEREGRYARYKVTLGYDDSERLTFDVKLYDFSRFAVGSPHTLKIKGDRILLDGSMRITPSGD